MAIHDFVRSEQLKSKAVTAAEQPLLRSEKKFDRVVIPFLSEQGSTNHDLEIQQA